MILFDIHTFLSDYYNQNPPLQIQCTDCATVVSVFSKLLGGSIHAVVIKGAVAHQLNTTYIRAIGMAQGWELNNFNFHVLNTGG